MTNTSCGTSKTTITFTGHTQKRQPIDSMSLIKELIQFPKEKKFQNIQLSYHVELFQDGIVNV